jgi:hypothetical protein
VAGTSKGRHVILGRPLRGTRFAPTSVLSVPCSHVVVAGLATPCNSILDQSQGMRTGQEKRPTRVRVPSRLDGSIPMVR